MPSTFSPVQLSDEPKLWKSEIGLLPPDTTAVAFDSISSLLSWLKTLSVDVDSNLTQLRALPKYAQLGQMQQQQQAGSSNIEAPTASVQQSHSSVPDNTASSQAQTENVRSVVNVHAPPTTEAGTAISPIAGFVPTRKVRERVGGGSAQVAALFGGLDEEPAPTPRVVPQPTSSISPTASQAGHSASAPVPTPVNNDNAGFVPTRKVRQAPGGGSAQMAAIFGGY